MARSVGKGKSMLATIQVEGLEIDCVIGIYDHERAQEQRILVDIAVDSDIADAAEQDKMEYSTNYVEIADAVTELAVERKYQLLETFAHESVTMLLERFDVTRAYIKIMKPDAIAHARWTAVTLERRR
jgi:dihydroneopterin aldolase